MNNIIKQANIYRISKNIKQLKKDIKQRLDKISKMEQLQKSQVIGKISKQITNIFLNQKLSNQKYQQRAIDYILQKTKDIKDKDQFIRLIIQDFTAIVILVKKYQNIIDSHAFDKELKKQQKNINELSYQQLFKFVNKFEEKINNVQERRKNRVTLPFKLKYSGSKFNMYEINREDKENFQNMFNGDNGTVTHTSWCVTFKDNNYFENYKPPYYLITKKNNSAEALVHIKSYQFKDIKDYRYTHNNPQVYNLVLKLLKENNIKTYKQDFAILLKFLSEQKKQQIINDYIQEKSFAYLLNCIEKDYLPNKLTDGQKQQIINGYIQKKSVDDLFYYIECGCLPNKFTKQQYQKIIDYYIQEKSFNSLLYYIKKGYLPKLTDQQYQKIINGYIQIKYFERLFQHIRDGNLPKLTDQQKEQIRKINPNIKLSNKTNISKTLLKIAEIIRN